MTASAAEKLGVQAGDALTGRITRARGLLREEVELPLRVKAVLPLSALQRNAAFAPLSLLEDAETYRDGMAVPARGWPGAARPEAERLYPSFRLYARDMDGVATLRDFFAARGIETYTRAEEIENVKMLDRSTSLVFGLICLAAGAGFLASTASNLIAAIPPQAPHPRHPPADRLFRRGRRLLPAGANPVYLRARHGAGPRPLRPHRRGHQRPFPGGCGSRGRLPSATWTQIAGAGGVVFGLSVLAALPPQPLTCSRLSPSEVIRNE